MQIGYQYIALIILGLAGAIWGLPASHRLKKPYDIAAALTALAGLISAVMGILLTFVPNFFR